MLEFTSCHLYSICGLTFEGARVQVLVQVLVHRFKYGSFGRFVKLVELCGTDPSELNFLDAETAEVILSKSAGILAAKLLHATELQKLVTWLHRSAEF